MRTFDVTQVAEFRDVFPELTDTQFETAMLLSLGLTRKEIALQRDVSHLVVRDMLQDINKRMDFHSTSNLISMFHVRLVCFALKQCAIKIKIM